MNPILKAHLEGVERMKKEIEKNHYKWCIGHSEGQWCHLDDEPENDENIIPVLKSFLTTYAESILNAVKEAGPEKRFVWGDENKEAVITELEHIKNTGFNSCRLSYHSTINEGIKEIKKGGL